MFAAAGSNAPVAPFVIPAPLQVPPGTLHVSVTTAPFSQKGPAALIIGCVPGFIATVVVVEAEQPFDITVTVYVPNIDAGAFGMLAFWVPPLNADGPDQEYAPPITLLAVRSICSPSSKAPLLFAMTDGCGLIVIVNEIGFPVQLPSDGVTVIVAEMGEPE